MSNLDAFRATKIGYIFQSFLLFPTLRAIENVQVPMFGGPSPPPDVRPRPKSCYAEVGLSHRLHHLPSSFRLANDNVLPSPGAGQRSTASALPTNRPATWIRRHPAKSWISSTACEQTGR